MTGIKETKGYIVFENDYCEISVSAKTALVEKVIDKKTGKDIKGEDAKFFSVYKNKTDEIGINGLSLKGDVITVDTELGKFDVLALAFDSYFTFEIVTNLPKGVYKLHFAVMKLSYDWKDKKNTGAVAISMSKWADPVDYPDAKSCATIGRTFPHLGDKGAKLGIVIAPIVEHKDIIQKLCLTIDKNVGIVSMTGGAFSQDSRLNYTNYTIQHETTPAWLADNIEYFKSIGVDQIDFHQGGGTFRQGDFKFQRYSSAAEFKKNVSDVLAKHGMSAGLHTYSFYISYNADTILSKPEYQKQLDVLTHLTLAEDIDESTAFIKIEENTDIIPTDRGFCKNNSPFLLIGEELINFEIAKDGLKVMQRGCAGTKAASHKKGEEVKHINGHYSGLLPIPGSDLFYKTARDTAKAYNEGGFNMIYLDALDGINHHVDKKDEVWFYITSYVQEVLKNCNTDPILEGADYAPGMWAGRGRYGAWDTPYRGYKDWNKIHAEKNLEFVDRHATCTLGWYDYYPTTDMYPPNQHTKYHHTDSMNHLGSLAVMYDFSNVFNGTRKEAIARIAGLKRNIAIYKKYDDLRKAQYFSKEYRQKLIDGPWEYHLKEKRGGKYVFVEKDYQIAKLFDLSDKERNVGSFKNPFGAQVPFVRIEAMLSTLKRNPMVLFKLNENEELTSQKLAVKFGTENDYRDNLAKVVKVYGNGKGGKICINLRCATGGELGYGEYIIDVNFKGWREFILLESDNGERKDHNFERNQGLYSIYRSSLHLHRIVGADIETEGDMTGVRMSSVVAYEHTYEVYKNPTVRIGDAWVQFECELQSGSFIEWDGKEAKVIDRYGNERPIWFSQENFKAPRGKFKASLEARALNRGVPRAQLTFGFTGKEIK